MTRRHASRLLAAGIFIFGIMLATFGQSPKSMAATSCTATSGNIVQNCSFESSVPAVSPGGLIYFPAGSTGITSWTVASVPAGGNDLTDKQFFGGFPVEDANLSLDLNRDDAGGIYQDLSTIVGQTYQVTFFMSGYPAPGAPCAAADPKSLVATAGATSQAFTFVPNQSASPLGNQSFDQHTMLFVATNSVTRLTFTSTTFGCAGPVIDDVSVVPLAPINTPTGTPTATATSTATPTPTATTGALATLNGSVTLQGLAIGTDSYQVTVDVRLSQGGGISTRQATTDANGNFSVTGLSPGTYDVEVKEARRIGRIARGLTLVAGNNSKAFGDLLAGDTNNDDSVTLVDYSRMRASYGKCAGDSGYQAGADSNGDGCIALQDYSRLRANYGVTGPLNAP